MSYHNQLLPCMVPFCCMSTKKLSCCQRRCLQHKLDARCKDETESTSRCLPYASFMRKPRDPLLQYIRRYARCKDCDSVASAKCERLKSHRNRCVKTSNSSSSATDLLLQMKVSCPSLSEESSRVQWTRISSPLIQRQKCN